MKSILIIEDQRSIVELLEFNLQARGYHTDYALDGESGLSKVRENSYDMLILDLMLPQIDGRTLCSLIRKDEQLRDLPIIMLTAKSSELDLLMGFELGADDYVTKPFSVKELIARVEALFKRSRHQRSEREALTLGSLVIDEASYSVFRGKQEIELTLKEFQLLKTLVEHHDRVFTRQQLLEEIWGYDYEGETRTVDVHIRYLRRKLGEEGERIRTVRGMGYKIVL